MRSLFVAALALACTGCARPRGPESSALLPLGNEVIAVGFAHAPILDCTDEATKEQAVGQAFRVAREALDSYQSSGGDLALVDKIAFELAAVERDYLEAYFDDVNVGVVTPVNDDYCLATAHVRAAPRRGVLWEDEAAIYSEWLLRAYARGELPSVPADYSPEMTTVIEAVLPAPAESAPPSDAMPAEPDAMARFEALVNADVNTWREGESAPPAEPEPPPPAPEWSEPAPESEPAPAWPAPTPPAAPAPAQKPSGRFEPSGKTLLIAPLKAVGTKKDAVVVITEFLRSAMVATGRYNVVSPEDMPAINAELERQLSEGCNSKSCLAEVGGALGAEKLLSGVVGKLGGAFSITLKLVDIAKVTTEATSEVLCQGCRIEDLPEKCSEAVDLLLVRAGARRQ